MNRPLSIAIAGTRGVPPRYGGFETFAGELSRRLVARGHRVTVYCRSSLYGDVGALWEGVDRIELPAIRQKYLETISHAFLSALDSWRRDFDVILLCNAANAPVIPLMKMRRVPVAINVDGIERKRKKWNVLGRLVYMLGESMSVRFADRIVADAEVIAEYYRENHGAESNVIAYGSDFPEEHDSDVLERLGVPSRGYCLYVSRMEPENNPIPVLCAWRRSGVTLPLVMVGSAPYSPALLSELERERRRGEGFLWPGGVYGVDYRTLQRHAAVYIQATEVGGTHPALIEAMRSGGAVLAYDTPENREVGGNAVRFFDFEGGSADLATVLKKSLDDLPLLDVYRSEARKRAERLYSWDGITRQYEALFAELCR